MAASPTLAVTGRSGKRYTLGLDSRGNAVCTCPSSRYSPKEARCCKHIEAAVKVLEAGKGPLPSHLLLAV